MKIVAATWERRNLGLDVTEVTLDHKDLKNEPETLEILKKYMMPRHYLLVKVPAGSIAFLAKLQALGFIFLEHAYRVASGEDICYNNQKFEIRGAKLCSRKQ